MKSAAQEAKKAKKPKKGAETEASPGVQLGKGSKQLFEFLQSGSLMVQGVEKFDASLNKEL